MVKINIVCIGKVKDKYKMELKNFQRDFHGMQILMLSN